MFDANEVARHLDEAHALRDRFEPLAGALRPTGLAEAYAAQEALIDLWRGGRRGTVAGYKIALTSKAVQELVGVEQPCVGAIFSGLVHRSPARISRDAFVRLGLEFEVCFALARDLDETGGGYTAERVLDAVAEAVPAFELIEDRDADYGRLDVESLVADNAWCGGVVLGEATGDWRSLDLSATPAILTYNGETETADTGAALGNPLTALAWAANLLATQGRPLREGMLVMTGSSMKTRFGNAGDRLRYEVHGLGAVEMEITG